MELREEERGLFQWAIKAFSEEFSLAQNWLITGTWEEGQEKILSLLTGKSFLSAYNLSFLNRPAFSFPYPTAFVSYQQRMTDKHATYYQQRFHSTEVDEIITLRKFLYDEGASFRTIKGFHDLLDLFRLRALLDEEVIKLSNGETRKALLLKAVLKNPQVLILDNPDAGLDPDSLAGMESLLKTLAGKGYCIIRKSKSGDLPSWISHVMTVDSPFDIRAGERSGFHGFSAAINHETVCSPAYIQRPPVEMKYQGTVVKLRNITVRYPEKRVLENLSWDIGYREKWQLKGENGAGKSTLLSIIYADHPQSYANDIEIFGKKRGSGESIWDIKENTGYYSPELFFYSDRTRTCEEVLLNGIYVNPYKRNEKKPLLEKLARDLFGFYLPVEFLSKPLNALSLVHQRLVIFLRALAGNSPLILLDEPFQGFDKALTDKSRVLVDWFCQDKTLVFVSHDVNYIPSCLHHSFLLKKV
jgi:molybdate transport system ATP-binding protein